MPDFDVRAWLVDLGFAGDELEAEVAKFAPRAAKIGEHQMRQSDYSRKQAELQAEQTRLKDADAQLTRDLADWSRMRAEGDPAADELRKKIDIAERAQLALRQSVTRLAEKAGVDPKDYLPIDDANPNPNPNPNPPQPTVPDNVLTRDQFGQAATFLVDLPIALQVIGREHEALLGQAFDPLAFVTQMRADVAAKKLVVGSAEDVRRYWEQQHDIPAKRAAKVEEARQADLRAAEERGYQRRATEQDNPVVHPTGSHAPIFNRKGPDGQPATSALQRPQPGDSHARHVAALNAGKYRQSPAGH